MKILIFGVAGMLYVYAVLLIYILHAVAGKKPGFTSATMAFITWVIAWFIYHGACKVFIKPKEKDKEVKKEGQDGA